MCRGGCLLTPPVIDLPLGLEGFLCNPGCMGVTHSFYSKQTRSPRKFGKCRQVFHPR